MRHYTVHAPPDDEPERYRFIKDGFSWPALFFAPLWILWHRMWLTLVWFIVFVLVVAWAGRLGGDDLASALGLLGAFFFGFEGNDMRRRSLAVRGYTDIGHASGANFAEAETRFFGARERPSNSALDRREAMVRAAFTPEARARGADEPILGLFPEPEH